MRSINAKHFGRILAMVLALTMTLGLLAGCGTSKNLAAEDLVLAVKDTEGTSEFVFSTQIPKNTVRSVTFLGSLEKAPKDALDVSQTGNGGVMMWTEKAQEGLQDLFIAAQGSVVLPEDCSYLFSSSEDLRKLGKHYRSLEEVSFGGNVDGSSVKSLHAMFYGCEQLTLADLEGFQPASVQDMSYLFADCKSLKNLDLAGFATPELTDVHNMLRYCVNLESLNLGGIQTGKVTDFSEMFSFCYNLKELDLQTFDTSSAVDMSKMFYQCKNLETLNVSSFRTDSVKDMSNLFASCKSLKALDLSGFQLAEKVKLKDMFNHCPKSMELTTDSEKLQGLFGMQSE